MRIAIVDGIAAHYRLSLFQKLSSLEQHEYTIYASDVSINGIKTIDPELSISSPDYGGIRWKFIRNLVLFNHILWQRNVISIALNGLFDLYIFIGEAHVLSTWLALLICRFRKKKVAFWGHGSYGNEKFLRKAIRKLFNTLPDAYLVYNERAAKILAREGFDPIKIFVVNNSLNYSAHLEIRKALQSEEIGDLKQKLFPRSHELPTLIFIGRLTPEKKIDQIIYSMDVLRKRGLKLNCVIIGTGQEKSSLKEQSMNLNLENNIVFYGACYDEKQNGTLISLSDCCVSPGNVGLTAIHCMTFGTPVITHNDLSSQGPEVSSVTEGLTGELFLKDDIDSLSSKIEELVFNKGKANYSEHCMKLIDDYYNPDFQVKIFNKMTDFLSV
jgi:glycosyltransferase involved in cell wall biosynthesis